MSKFFQRTAKAHHEAFRATNGEDPDWPTWYAEFLLDPLSRALGRACSVKELSELLKEVDREYRARSPGQGWPEYYAHFILDRSRSGSARG